MPSSSKRPREEVAGLAIDPREDEVTALDERDLAARPRVKLRELAAHGSGSDDQEALRHGLRARPFAARPGCDLVQAFHGRHRWNRARGDHQLVVLELPPVDLHLAGSHDMRPPSDHLGVELLHPFHLARVVLLRHLVTPLEDLHGIDLRGDAGGQPRPEGDLQGTEQRLRGDAGPVGAFPAHELVLDERDAHVLVQPAERAYEGLAGRTAAEHHDVSRHQ